MPVFAFSEIVDLIYALHCFSFQLFRTEPPRIESRAHHVRVAQGI